jgi:hypothetical protein
MYDVPTPVDVHTMRRTVDVFLKDRCVASYPVVVEIDRPDDDDYTAEIKRYMSRRYSKRDIIAAKFIVRDLLE